MTSKRKLWFIRRGGQVKGPFPDKVVSQYFLLGRLRDTDEVSEDRALWRPLFEVDELIPEVMKLNPTDPETRYKLEAALRGADERLGGDRRADDDSSQGRRGGDRRAPEDPEVAARRQRRSASPARTQNRQSASWAVGVVVLVMIAGALGALLLYSPTARQQVIDCDALPGPGVNWSNCRKTGARLDGVDLRGAVLRNADLSGASMAQAVLAEGDLAYANVSLADLSQANMNNAVLTGVNFHRSVLRGAVLHAADLSYADLRGADLTHADLEGARLDRAIWIDGATCAHDSISRCIAEP